MNTAYLKKLFLSFVLAWGATSSVFGANFDLWDRATGSKDSPNDHSPGLDYSLVLANGLSIEVPLPDNLPFPNTIAKTLSPGQRQSTDVDYVTIKDLVDAIEKAALLSRGARVIEAENRMPTLIYKHKLPPSAEIIVLVALCFKASCNPPPEISWEESKKGFVVINFSELLIDSKSDL